MREQYLPQWYFLKKEKEYKKKLRKTILILGAFTIISLINTLGAIKGLKNYENRIYYDGKTNKEETQGLEIYYSYNYLYEILKEVNLDIKKLNVDNQYIYLEIYAKDISEFRDCVDVLEKKFVIEEITTLQKEEPKDFQENLDSTWDMVSSGDTDLGENKDFKKEEKEFFSIRMKVYEN